MTTIEQIEQAMNEQRSNVAAMTKLYEQLAEVAPQKTTYECGACGRILVEEDMPDVVAIYCRPDECSAQDKPDGAGWYIFRQYQPNGNGEDFSERVERWEEYPPRKTTLETYYGPFASEADATTVLTR